MWETQVGFVGFLCQYQIWNIPVSDQRWRSLSTVRGCGKPRWVLWVFLVTVGALAGNVPTPVGIFVAMGLIRTGPMQSSCVNAARSRLRCTQARPVLRP